MQDGYHQLEFDLLCRLREGELKSKPGARKGSRSFDNATAFRLLQWHSDSMSRLQAVAEQQSDAQLRDAIDARFRVMRDRLAATPTAPAAAQPTQPAQPIAITDQSGETA